MSRMGNIHSWTAAAAKIAAMSFCSLPLILNNAYSSEISLFLIPKFRMDSDRIEIRDIARLETRDAKNMAIGEAAVDESIYADNFIDRREIIDFLKTKTGGTVNVYGGGVMIIRMEDGNAGKDSPRTDSAVKKGDRVRYTVIKGGVRIEINGTAMDEGIEGENITVKLMTNKIVQGRISSDNRIERGL